MARNTIYIGDCKLPIDIFLSTTYLDLVSTRHVLICVDSMSAQGMFIFYYTLLIHPNRLTEKASEFPCSILHPFILIS